MQRTKLFHTIMVVFFCTAFGCSKRQLMPGIIAGSGGALFASGTIYRIALPKEDSEGLFGRQPEQKAVTATLMLTGMALMIAGIIWSAVTPVCQEDADCWVGDVCDKKTETCVPRPAAQPVESPSATSPSAARLRVHGLDPLRYDRFRLNLASETAPPDRL